MTMNYFPSGALHMCVQNHQGGGGTTAPPSNTMQETAMIVQATGGRNKGPKKWEATLLHSQHHPCLNRLSFAFLSRSSFAMACILRFPNSIARLCTAAAAACARAAAALIILSCSAAAASSASSRSFCAMTTSDKRNRSLITPIRQTQQVQIEPRCLQFCVFHVT